MADTALESKVAQLNHKLEQLRQELGERPAQERDTLEREIERTEQQLRDLELDQRNMSSHEGGSE